MIVGKINLAMFKHVITKKKSKSGEDVEGIFIPIKMNNLFKSDKGNVYLDIIAFDSVNEEYKQTHSMKQSLPKEVREAMSEEEQKNTPFIGHLNANIGRTEETPNDVSSDMEDNGSGDDDLPF